MSEARPYCSDQYCPVPNLIVSARAAERARIAAELEKEAEGLDGEKGRLERGEALRAFAARLREEG